MKNAAHSRIRPLPLLLILVGLAFSTATASAAVGVWTTNGPGGGDVLALAIDPWSPGTLYAGTSDRGIFQGSFSVGPN
jgi:hypothetical protein